MSDLRVSQLNIYPIKSCAGVEVERMPFTERGPEYDRDWMVVGAKGQPLTQRNHPELATVKPFFQDDALQVISRIGRLSVPLAHKDGEEVPVRLWKKPGSGVDQGEEAREYFSEVIGGEARLLRIQQPRTIQPECQVEDAPNTIGFADGFPLLLASKSSLMELNESLTTLSHAPMDRFRPNIVVEGAPAYAEDYWREVSIGDVSARVMRACARCSIPNINQVTGRRPSPIYYDVTRVLRETRRGLDEIGGEKPEVFFGQNLVHVYREGMAIAVGDLITVEASANESNFKPLPSAYPLG